MTAQVPIPADEKALKLNLDHSIYGTFAEIGAGQEVANWFFRASASAGTVAKTISAYDMTISDTVYGKCQRYVSQDRLIRMLDYEYELLEKRLTQERGDRSKFFSFCNTVRARAYQDTGECHGWMGIRFQPKSGAPSGTIVLHVRLLEEENVDQMEALGILGVNLIWAAYNHSKDLPSFVASLIDSLTPGRVEIDMLKFFGEPFKMVDNRLCALELVTQGHTPATVFLPDCEVVQAAEAFYKTPLLMLRGSFLPVTKLHLDMLAQSSEVFPPEGAALAENAQPVREVCEVSLSNLLRDGEVDLVSFIDRVDALQALGKVVMISNCPEFHRVAAVLRIYTNQPIGLVLSIGLLNELFKEKWSENLAGGILESFGRLFKTGLTLLVYPWKNRANGELVTAETFRPPEHLQHLYRHFLENGMIRGVDCGDGELLEMTGRDILQAAHAGAKWEKWVPEEAKDLVLNHRAI
ncbi:MAG: TonB-dependent receptor [Akkermansiaceae bacterium]